MNVVSFRIFQVLFILVVLEQCNRKQWGSDSNSVRIFVSDNEKCVLFDLTDTYAADLGLPAHMIRS